MRRFICILYFMFGVVCSGFITAGNNVPQVVPAEQVSATTLTISGNVQWFKAFQLAIKYLRPTGYWTDWTDWSRCNIDVKFDFANDIIVIYSQETQVYKILAEKKPPYDSSGSQAKFRIIDQDGDYGHLRLRVENNGNTQIYVDFADVCWVYNVRRQ